MAQPEKVSAVLIALDEERRIGAALDSLGWADEIVVVDGGSSDATAEIGREKGAVVIERPFTGFVEQKNFALSRAAHDWVISLDADEVVSPPLAEQIEVLRGRGFGASGYRIPRAAFYLGRFIRSTEWYPDRQLRLFDRRRGQWQGAYVHESVRVEGAVEELTGEILHYPYENLAEHLETMNRYSSLAARQMHEAGRRGGLLSLVLYPPIVFLKNYLLKSGFRDGSAGFAVSALNAFYVFLKYSKLRELGRGKDAAPDRT